MNIRLRWSWLALVAAFGLLSAQTTAPTSAQARPATRNIPHTDAKAILDTIRHELLPPGLRAGSARTVESVWPEWVSSRDAHIRARLADGDGDSVINLLLFGVTFTDQPRVRAGDILRLAIDGRVADVVHGSVVQRRIDDMITGIASPGTNERLQLVREVVEAAGIDLTAAGGASRVRRHIEDGLRRVLAEYEAYAQAPASDRSVRFDDRGLSSDTSLSPGLAIEQALQAIQAARLLDAGSVRRVGIVGPGLDFADKREGYDFYPQQTLQPFAVIDSLVRLGLATRDQLRASTFDLSPRVNRHLEAARQRARSGAAYVLHLPRDTESGWVPELVGYWERFGDRIGAPVQPAAPPAELAGLDVRAVRVPAAVLLTVTPHDLNIVLQRLEPLAAGERFDLIVATNLLVYYDVFERSLALANVAHMLRPGGLFLANNSTPVILPASLESVGDSETVFSTQVNDRDRIYWYQKK